MTISKARFVGRSNLLFSQEVYLKNYNKLLAQEPFLQITTAYLQRVIPNFQRLKAGHRFICPWSESSRTPRTTSQTPLAPQSEQESTKHSRTSQNELPGTTGPGGQMPAATQGIQASKLKCQRMLRKGKTPRKAELEV